MSILKRKEAKQEMLTTNKEKGAIKMKTIRRNLAALLVVVMFAVLMAGTPASAAMANITWGGPNSIAYSSTLGMFAIIGYSDLILTSVDGSTWTKRTVQGSTGADQLGTGYQGALTWGNNKFVGTTNITGKVLVSDPAGDNWSIVSTVTPTNLNFTQICYEPTSGYFIASSTDTIWESTDALNWTQITIPIGTDTQNIYNIIAGPSGTVYAWQSRLGGIQKVYIVSVAGPTPTAIVNQMNSTWGGDFADTNLYAGGVLYTGDGNSPNTKQGIKAITTVPYSGNFCYAYFLGEDPSVVQSSAMWGMGSNGQYVLGFPYSGYWASPTYEPLNINVFAAGSQGETIISNSVPTTPNPNNTLEVKSLLNNNDLANVYPSPLSNYTGTTTGPYYTVAAQPNGYFVAALGSGHYWENTQYWNIVKISNIANVSPTTTPSYNMSITNQADTGVGNISISGNSTISIPMTGVSISAYTASIVNSFNTPAPTEASYTWSSGPLPTGVSFNPATGVATVSSMATNGASFTITATSVSEASVMENYTITLATSGSSGGAMQFMNSGTAISSLGSGGSITGSTYVSNYTGYNVTAVLLLAHYKGTKLIGVTTSSAVISPGNGTQITTNPLAISATHTNESLKLFLWNGYGSLTPLTSSTITS